MRTCVRRPAPLSFGPLLVALALGLPAPAPAVDYFPLVSGTRWECDRVPSEPATVEVFGIFDLLGNSTTRVLWTQVDQIYENFWSRDAQGRLYLHGARNLTFPFEAAYTPPILILNPPMSLGQTWTTPGVVMTDFGGGNPGLPFDFTYGAGYVGPLSVPAGTFDVVGVGDLLPTGATFGAGEGLFDPLGRRRPAPGPQGGTIDPVYWFNDGTGLIQFRVDAGEPFRLVRFSAPTPLAETSWSRIKSLLAR